MKAKKLLAKIANCEGYSLEYYYLWAEYWEYKYIDSGASHHRQMMNGNYELYLKLL